MHVISMFATKGGAGRTVTAMALASGFLARGKRVALLDCSDQVSRNGVNRRAPLRQFLSQMRTCGFKTDQLDLVSCLTAEDVADSVASARTRGVDIVLADTPAMPGQPALAVFDLSDLIIAPANGALEARYTVNRIHDYMDNVEKVMGLIGGCRRGAPVVARTREQFNFLEVFHTELPYSDVCDEQIVVGDLKLNVASLTCAAGEPRYGWFKEAEAAWAAVEQLADEVQWMLRGYRLEAVEPLFDQGPSRLRVSA